jgi:hypothetical protein
MLLQPTSKSSSEAYKLVCMVAALHVLPFVSAQVDTTKQLIVNGGFENAAFFESKCGSWCSSSNASLIAPWTFSGQSTYELNFGVWKAFEGKISMDLSSSGPVTISQVVPTTIGQRYVVSFQLNDNSCGSPTTTRTGKIVATGAQPLAFGHKAGFQSANPSPWTEVKYYFFATGSMTTISISSTDPSSCGPIVDQITMFATNELIVNGGFENGAFFEPSCGSWCSNSDASLISPWTFSGQSVYELNFGVWKAFEGKISMDLSSSGPITISQVVPTTIGERYVVSFKLNDNSCNSPTTTRTGKIVATGAQPLAFGHKAGFQSANPSPWTEVNYYFFATDAKTTVSISSTDPSSCGPIVDQITMSATSLDQKNVSSKNAGTGLASNGAASEELIVNGGFENAAFYESSCPSWCSPSDASLIAPWTFSGQSTYELNFGVWKAFEGKISMDLSSSGPVTISQVVPTTAGKQYVVSFQLNDNSCGSPTTNRTGKIVATGAQPLSFGHMGGFQSAKLSPWTEVKYYFFATGSKTTISISSTDASGCGPVVDKISMVATNLYIVTKTVTDTILTTKTHAATLYYDGDLKKFVSNEADIKSATATVFTTVYNPVIQYVNTTTTDSTQTITPAAVVTTIGATASVTLAPVIVTATKI